jgi:CRISPR-associated protein Cas1
MKRHLNTLYVTTQGAYLAKDGETVLVRVDGETRLRVPIHNLGGIVCFGNVSASPFLLGFCARRDVAVSFLTERGRFLARVLGSTSGNVLLRREQYRRADDPNASADIARAIVTAKVANSRTLLQRALRDHAGADAEALKRACIRLAQLLGDLQRTPELDSIRGVEGMAARVYFEVFDQLILHQKEDFAFNGRSRRPPLDNVNALLSFGYTLLRHDVEAALESVGLDPAVGFLHRDRPGRPGLALDLMEEFRPFLVDRLALSLINLKQVKGSGFTRSETGGVWMDDGTRKEVLVAYQKRKQDEITHPFLGEKTTVGLLFHLQALLMARYLRGDLDGYPPFVAK